jgi:hypothetical protein
MKWDRLADLGTWRHPLIGRVTASAQAPRAAPEEARDIVIDIDIRWGDGGGWSGR